MSDVADDVTVVEAFRADMEAQARALVDKRNAKRERRKMYAPWGGIFDKDLEPEVFIAPLATE